MLDEKTLRLMQMFKERIDKEINDKKLGKEKAQELFEMHMEESKPGQPPT